MLLGKESGMGEILYFHGQIIENPRDFLKESQILNVPIERSPHVGEHKFLQNSTPPKWMHLGIQNDLS